MAVEELRELRAFDRRPILEAIRQQLTYEPTVVTRNRKLLEPLVPDFEAVPPIWELRVGNYCIFYDVDEEEKIVYIRAVRYKARYVEAVKQAKAETGLPLETFPASCLYELTQVHR